MPPQSGSAGAPPNEAPPEPIAICGSSLLLPGNISTGQELFELIRNKIQMRGDCVALGRAPPSIVEPEGGPYSGNPWKLKSRYYNIFSEEERESYDCHFFRVTSKLSRVMSRDQVGALQATWQALEDAGIPAHKLYRTRTAVMCGTYVLGEMHTEAPDETNLRGQLMSSVADHVAYFLGTHGPTFVLETACSSSMVALAMAVATLRKGDADTVLLLAHNTQRFKDFTLSLQACGVLSVSGTSHPFDDSEAKGYVRCEGWGALVLQRITHAQHHNTRIVASLLNATAASGGVADGALEGAGRMYESPCEFGIRELLKRSYEGACLCPSVVSYLECHATGTTVGDLIELNAIGAVVGEARKKAGIKEPLRIASVKSNIGHAELAAGLFSIIKVLEMFRHRVFLPSAGVRVPRQDFDWTAQYMTVQQDTTPFPSLTQDGITTPITIGVNSFGIGGSYGHAILQEYVAPTTPIADGPPVATVIKQSQLTWPLLFPLSSPSPQHLQAYARELCGYVSSGRCSGLRDVCGTMALHRSQLKYRTALQVHSLEQLQSKLEAVASGGVEVGACGSGFRRVLLVFTGQGAQWPGMATSLLHFPAYAQVVREADAVWCGLSGWSLLDKAPTLTATELSHTHYAQPLTFLTQVGLFHLLLQANIKPYMVLGHSAGEVSSAYACGLLSLEEAVRVVYHRTAEQHKLAGCGRLLAVALGLDECLALPLPGTVEVACVNSGRSVVLAGSEAELLGLKDSLPQGVTASLLPGNIAFHSSRVDPALGPMLQRLAFLDDPCQEGEGKKKERVAWRCAMVSSVTGQLLPTLSASYWVDNVRQPVLLQHAINLAFSPSSHSQLEAPDLVLEVGPHRTLLGPIKQCLTSLQQHHTGLLDSLPPLCPTLSRNEHCATVLTALLGSLFDKGHPVDFTPLFQPLGYKLALSLPKHPFLKKVMHGVVPVDKPHSHRGLYLTGPIAGSPRVDGLSWSSELSRRTSKAMCDHVMGGQTIAPGMLYVEMALEALGQLPCVLTNVDFKSMCKIPSPADGQVPTTLVLSLSPSEGSTNNEGSGEAGQWGSPCALSVTSLPLLAKPDLSTGAVPLPQASQHCTGYAMTLTKDLPQGTQLLPGSFGLMAQLDLHDIGKDGVSELLARHSSVLACSKEHFYGLINQEGVVHYGPSFQVICGMWADFSQDTYVARLEFDSKGWQAQGGVWGVQLLDGLFQMGFLTPAHDPNIVIYAGGFEACYFLKRPSGNGPLYAYLQHDSKIHHMGRKQDVGDMLLYDEDGVLLLATKSQYIIKGTNTGTTQLTGTHLQPLCLPLPPLREREREREGSIKGLAQAVYDAALALHLHNQQQPIVFRILEVCESSSLPLVVEALSRLPTPPSGVLLEAFVGSMSGPLLHTLGTHVAQAAQPWLRLRKVLLSCVSVELVDVSLQALVLNDWTHSGSSAWVEQDVRDVLGPYLCPQALVAVHGLDTDADLHKHSHSHGDTNTATAQWTDWMGPQHAAVLSCEGSEEGSAAMVTVLGRFSLTLTLSPSATTGQAATPHQHHQHHQEEEEEAGPVSSVLVLGCSEGDVSLQRLGTQLKALATSRARGLGRGKKGQAAGGGGGVVLVPVLRGLWSSSSASDGDEEKEEEEEWAEELRHEVVRAGLEGRPVQGMLLLAFQAPRQEELEEGPMSMWGEQAFGVLAQAARAVSCLTADLTDQRHDPLSKRPLAPLWLVTQGVHSLPNQPKQCSIRLDQAAVAGLGLVLANELDVQTRLVDLLQLTSSPASFSTSTSTSTSTGGGVEVEVDVEESQWCQLAWLLSECPKETQYVLHPTRGPLVVRHSPLPTPQLTAITLQADCKELTYVADVGKGISTPGQLNVEWLASPAVAPKEGEVVVEVVCAALNFRDVLMGISLLPELSYQGSYFGRHLGMEAAGIVSAVGPNVHNIKVGDRVATAEARCFANRLIAPAQRLVLLPPNMPFEVAASVQSVYNTAHYALIDLARIKPGELVLVHAAAGGVGHAAISVCLDVGCRVLATCSVGKQAVVKALGVEAVFDSRSTSWFKALMQHTNNRGVDVVLNSLANTHQQLGIQALSPGGRFLEIGKADVYANAKVGLMALRKNAALYAIDMDRLALDDPVCTLATTTSVFAKLQSGAYHPLPYTKLPMGQIKEAMDLLKSGKHVGKVVLSNYVDDYVNGEPPSRPVSVTASVRPRLWAPDATYVITGAAGGFGSRVVRCAFEQGARHFVLSVSSRPERVAKLFHDILACPGASLTVVEADVGKASDVRKLLSAARQSAGLSKAPLKGIIHVAGVSLDRLVSQGLGPADLRKVGAAKAMGAWHLHQQTLQGGDAIHSFVAVSSVASLLGGRGRGAYVAANECLDALMRQRQSMGLPGCSFQMGSLSDVGIVANDMGVRKFQLAVGTEFVQAMRALEDLQTTASICNGSTGLASAAQLFWSDKSLLCYANRASFLHGIAHSFTLGTDRSDTANRALTPREVASLVLEAVKSIGGHEDVPLSSPLSSVGMDSFSTVELGSRLKTLLGVELNVAKLGQGITVAELIKMVQAQTNTNTNTTTTTTNTSAAPSQPTLLGSIKPPLPLLPAPVPAKPLPPPVAPALQTGAFAPLTKDVSDISNASSSDSATGSVSSPKDKPQDAPQPTGCLPLLSRRGKASKRSKGKEAEGEVEMDVATARRWLVSCNPQALHSGLKGRLVCFPWAGSTAKVYSKWTMLHDTVDVLMVTLPGRDGREGETPIRDIKLIAKHVLKALELLKFVDVDALPLSLYGHSHGAFWALELALQLKEELGFRLHKLILGGPRSLHAKFFWSFRLPQAVQMYLVLSVIGGLPDQVSSFSANNWHTVRETQADLALGDNYKCRTDKYLDCPVVLMFGSNDTLTPPSKVAVRYVGVTSKSLTLKIVEGAPHLFPLYDACLPELQAFLRDTLLDNAR